MKWTRGGQSGNIEDRRSQGGRGLRSGGARIGLGGTIVLLVLSVIFKTDLFSLLGTQTGVPGAGVSQSDPARDAAEQPLVEFVSFVLDDAQGIWTQLLPQQTDTAYRNAKLVLFRDYIQSGCGGAESAVGPFYCPADEKVYIDLGFFDELSRRFGAPGQFAQAYVLAHELGHHIQTVTGISAKVRQLQERNPREANPLSVRLELQADCLAGVWAHSTQQRGLLERGDVESALNAASSIGDDRLQEMSTGRVRPESFTHGSSQQRMDWFNRGLNNGTFAACNTFN